MRTQGISGEICRLLEDVPFRPFVIALENGQRIEVEHPENIVFPATEHGPAGRDDFYVRSGATRLYSIIEAVTSIAVQDEIVTEE